MTRLAVRVASGATVGSHSRVVELSLALVMTAQVEIDASST